MILHGEKEISGPQQPSPSKTPRALTRHLQPLLLEDPCSLPQGWPQLTELHGDYAAEPLLELKLPRPNQLAPSCPSASKVYPINTSSQSSGNVTDCSIRCADINASLPKKKDKRFILP
ncbi:hypothetical protein Cadr_000002173 [Camelus dromedarius]|uniref:Uncharacterized protein n=1 Tax=Camelus dromedarius TaxID=9838 RepID=A0A5N4EG60_CAMDR|nr:hypothetical protein Cadr_000002173 [Camelus dromedarius]